MTVLRNADLPEERWRPGTVSRTLVGRELGSEKLTVVESMVEPGGGAPLHRHDEEEVFLVLEGTVEARVGEKSLVAPAGYTLRVPSGTDHSFRAVGPESARIVLIFPVHDPLDPEHTVYLEGDRADTTRNAR